MGVVLAVAAVAWFATVAVALWHSRPRQPPPPTWHKRSHE